MAQGSANPSGEKATTAMFTKLAIAGATLAALTMPVLAATSQAERSGMRTEGQWFVLQDAGGTQCYAANRAPGPDEGRVAGGFASEQQAEAMLSQLPECQANNVQPGKDSTASNS